MGFKKKLMLSGIVNDSVVDGPGLRYTIFTQGCPHHCPGCHNPQTHPFKGGKKANIKQIKKDIISNPLLYGVTFSGGEPFMQAKALLPIAKFVKEQNLELAVYSGFTFEELLKMPDARELLNYVDVLIDGKFKFEQKSLDLKYKGSSNQRIITVPLSIKGEKIVLCEDKKWI